MDADRMPGDAEADAAIAGMHELYGRKLYEHAVGDEIWAQARRGECLRPVRVTEVNDNGRMVVRDERLGRSFVIDRGMVSER